MHAAMITAFDVALLQSYLRALLLLTRVYIPALGKLIEKEEEVKSMFSLIDPIRRLTGELFRAVHVRYLAPGTPHDKLAQSFLPLLSPVYGAPASCPHMEVPVLLSILTYFYVYVNCIHRPLFRLSTWSSVRPTLEPSLG